MAWTAPKTWTAEVLTSSDLNTHLRDNLIELKDPPEVWYTPDEGSDLSLTSTSFAYVDNTDDKFSLTLTTNGGMVLVICDVAVNIPTGTVASFDLEVDGVQIATGFGNGMWRGNQIGQVMLSFCYPLFDLSAGSHTVKLMYKVNSGTLTVYRGAGTANSDTRNVFGLREVS